MAHLAAVSEMILQASRNTKYDARHARDGPAKEEAQGVPGQRERSVERTQPSTPSHAAHITLAVVPRIAGTTFTAWTEFFAFWDQFEREQSVVYRTRDCQTAKLYNITRTNHPKRQIPASFGYAFRKYVCTLGRKQKSRSTGKRAKRKERYRACKAMFRVAVVRADGCGVQNAFGQTNTDTKQIVSYVTGTTGLPITTQQVRNLIYARLGHGNAEQRLKAVLTEFASTEDNEGVLLQGDWNQTVGIGLQTKAQQKIFSRWGDMLALDWTHNCTNFGFYVAKNVLLVVLKWFKMKNPSWGRLQSLVIDKVFTEWSTFREIFPQAARIAYVRLKKGASSKHTVLSECEKYNVVRAEVIALVDGLQQLSSSKFYEIFADLRATVDIFKKKWDLDQISLLHPGVSDDDEDHDFDFDDSGEKGESTVEQVAQLPDENETDAPVAPDDLSQCVMMNPSQVSLPDIVVSEQSQETLQLEATTSPTPELEAHPADTLEMLKLPASSNARAKDLRKGSKWAITEFGSGCPIHLGAFWFDRDAGGEKLLNFQSTRRRGSSPTTDNASANTTPFVQQRVLPEVVAVPLLYPKQTDSVSCGMLSIAQAYSYVRHVRSLKTSKSIPQNDITQMRLRLLWTLLHESSAADEDKDVQFWADMVEIRKKIKKAFDTV
ncbi:hypothetical protein PC110_g11298 [Phytophthora cactorum]|uniref:Ubiquitin-like protease family profile domain-containing protein n=1 Tax=Phytophthora cactorum TaxID=29920 RepID=A0A329S611_9STRA|nr:hypothetical protein PC110_g11298 [Phytophthora cactorum]